MSNTMAELDELYEELKRDSAKSVAGVVWKIGGSIVCCGSG